MTTSLTGTKSISNVEMGQGLTPVALQKYLRQVAKKRANDKKPQTKTLHLAKRN
jgi:hypothetical protein